LAGIVSKKSRLSVPETVDRLRQEIDTAGAKLFTSIDHSGEAASVGLSLRDTKLILFGNPAMGTGVMAEEPLAALDLPLRVLVWQDDGGDVWMSYIDPAWLANRYGLATETARPLRAVERIVGQVADPGKDPADSPASPELKP
jgi:uncharacterized protein (DUF302 family)